ncbi:hypothetical protein [Shinella sp.]|uniref:hypothetical protein n=1 Tax=Shinella sp. TaxID=1870904 RepID=UPI0028AEF546|nr:hypothetical protein [Shinella sp.]
MPLRRFRSPLPELPPTERLARALRNIDKHLEQARSTGQPAPLSAYRARRILHDALHRCRETGNAYRTAAHRLHRSAPEPNETGFPEEPGDLRGCRDAPFRTDLPARECNRDTRAYEGKSMAYDWTGESTRKRNRLRLASALFVSLIIVVALPMTVTPFL